jgi:hypothetical protein
MLLQLLGGTTVWEQILPAACRALEPRPTKKNIEDEDDDEYEDALAV